MRPQAPPPPPSAFAVQLKPAGARCNLACDYCYYRAKEALYPESDFRMSDALLEAAIREVLAAHPGPDVPIGFQGGEPTLLGLDFFRRAAAYADRHRRPGQRVRWSLQTNGAALDDAWAGFLRRRDFLVGVSVDGPRALHDAFRRDRRGRPSFDAALRGIAALSRHGVAWNALCALHRANAADPVALYRFFRDELGARFVQFIPVVEPAGRGASARSLDGEAYGHFLCAVFDEWVARDVGRVFVQDFDEALAAFAGLPAGVCVRAPTCGDAVVIEHTGDVYACDHYVDAPHRLGNFAETPLRALLDSEAQRRFGRGKRATLPDACLRCDVRFACHGGCPKDRLERGRSWLCEGYRAFFRHVAAPMRRMAQALRRGEPPAGATGSRTGRPER
jgi:uncharacterized protein